MTALPARDAAAFRRRAGYLLWRGALRARGLAETALEPLGLRARHYALLSILDVLGPVSQRQLAEQAGVDASRVVALVDELERGRLVRRRRNPADRRAYLLHLTVSGRRALAKARVAVEGVERALLSDLSAPERRQLLGLLRRVARE